MTPSHDRTIVALIGSTASGKTDLALSVAEKIGATIISCDSLLVYKELDIATAKPKMEEILRVPHVGINVVDPDQAYTAGDFVRDVRPIIDKLYAEGKPILIAGGTGFYLKALLFGVWDAPATQPEFRKELENSVAELAESERGPVLWKQLYEKDPDYANKVKPQDLYRIVRGLEIMHVTGNTVTAQSQEKKLQNPLPYPFQVFGIRRSPRDLERRIAERTNAMFQNGIIAETKNLLQKYPSIPKSLQSVGYSEVIDFLAGKLTLPECRERVLISTRQLAKKQRTFFNTFPGITWRHLPEEQPILEEELLRLLSGKNPGKVSQL